MELSTFFAEPGISKMEELEKVFRIYSPVTPAPWLFFS